MTPFEVLYGYSPLCIYEQGVSVVSEVDNMLRERDMMLKKLMATLQRAQQHTT